MYDLVRDSPFGQIVRYCSQGRIFTYSEERPGFVVPRKYASRSSFFPSPRSQATEGDEQEKSDFHSEAQSEKSDDTPFGGDRTHADDLVDDEKHHKDFEARLSFDPTATKEHMDVERHADTTNAPAKDASVTIVTWYSDNDPDNPQNWSQGKKLWMSAVIVCYTLSVYITASLYTASIPVMRQKWGLSAVGVSVGLSLYVLGYGTGPLILSPLSEIPQIGRNPPYIICFAIFVILCLPTALVDNYAGMLVLRFLSGLFGSPALTSGGASFGDFYGPLALPYAIGVWMGTASAGPSIGPVISNFAVQAENWRWPFWESLWMAGPVFIAMFFAMPETSSDWILLERAKRLRKITGRTDIKAECEVRQQKQSRKQVLNDALVKPWEINAKDPAVLFTTIYTGLLYGIYYSYFESFPLVFQGTYKFSAGITGVAFLALAVGAIIACAIWIGFFYFYGDKQLREIMATGVTPPPESRLAPGLVFTWLIPAGLFLYAWTARASIHWIVPLIGVVITIMGTFIVANCMMIYLPFCYPRYSSSLYAANGLSRALLAASAILFSIPMFENMEVDKGVTLLAGLCCGCSAGVYFLFFYGAKLRERSKFAES